MTDYIKALRLLAYMARISRAACFIDIDDILHKTSHEELDFYYRWCCE